MSLIFGSAIGQWVVICVLVQIITLQSGRCKFVGRFLATAQLQQLLVWHLTQACLSSCMIEHNLVKVTCAVL
jgi:hypothetical protein